MAKLFQIPKVAGVTKATAKQQMLKQLICSDAPEQALRYRGHTCIAGVDEVGRGALFGPVVAAAVILPPKNATLLRMGLKDSKQLTREEREKLDRKVRKTALAIGVAEIDAATIDRVNIYHATRLAMLRAVEALGLTPDHILIDAMLIDHPCPQTKLFYGDALCLSIAAASVIAKVHRDGLMRELDRVHPEYGLAQHKGYGTPEHRKALAQHGPTPLHRRSFNWVAESDPNALLEDTLSEADLYLDDPLSPDPSSLTTNSAVIPTGGAANSPVIPTGAAANSTVISTGGAAEVERPEFAPAHAGAPGPVFGTRVHEAAIPRPLSQQTPEPTPTQDSPAA